MQVRSFDLFDTLIGRFHFHPHSIFYLVQEKFPFPGFAFFRIMAEYRSDKTLSDIYRHFQELTGVSEETARALKEFEFQTELDHIFPIWENFSAVSDGDLVVSDTYYDLEQIQKILDRIGLNKKVHIYATPCGKSAGFIWDQIKLKHEVLSHKGDNPHADVFSPNSKNLRGVHYTNSELSANEKKMIELGHETLGFLMRSLRLSNPYEIGSAEYFLWNDQCQINIPILIQSSLFLDGFCQKLSKNRVLFTSRDGCLWIQIFKKLFPQYESLYFHASRYLYIFPNPDFISYVRKLYTEDALIVDVHGSGFSCTTFFRKSLKMRPTYLTIVSCRRRQNAILRVKSAFETMEKLNYDKVGSLYDMQGETPIRAEVEYDVRFVEPSHRCVQKCIDMLSHYSFSGFDPRVIKWLIKKARSPLAIDHCIDHATHHVHIPKSDGFAHIHLLCSGRQIEVGS